MANEPYKQTNFPFEVVYATESQWLTSGDFVLQRYQLGVESNTGNAKLGDGDSTWDELYYWPPNAGYDNNTSVRVATTANITIATALNNGDTLDGVTLATGDLVLVKNQSAPEENGIYVVGVTPIRAPAYDVYNDYPGAMVSVTEGTVGGNTLWLCTSNRGGTLGTTAIDFAAFGTPETTTSLGALINGAVTATLADADLVPVVQGSVTLKTTFTAIKAFLATWLGFTAASAAGPTSLVFKEDTDNGAHGITLKAPAAVTADVDVVLPDEAGTIALKSELAAYLPTASLLRSYLATTVTYNNTDTLADTALSVTVVDGGKYAVELVVHSTSAVKGLKMDFAGTVTPANFIGSWAGRLEPYNGNAGDHYITARVADIGTGFGPNQVDAFDAFYTFTGSLEVTTGGTFLLRGAQNAADPSNTTILQGSTLILTKTN